MRRRHAPLPTLWLFTDERIDDVAFTVARLPRGAGVVFRHHNTPPQERRVLFERVRRIARRRMLTILLADTPARARCWHADGAHHRSRLASHGLRSVAAHDAREVASARSVSADVVFMSPVFPTHSHPGARPLGIVRLGLTAGALRRRVVALGGMNRSKLRRIFSLGLHGWAAIDALS